VLAVMLAALLPAAVPAAVSNDAALSGWLRGQNRTQAVFIQELRILQAGHPAPLYDQVGREDENAQLDRRPILQRANPAGPFSTANRWVARVDRGQGIAVYLRLQIIQPDAAQSGRITYQPPAESFIQFLPQKDLARISMKNGVFHLQIPDPQSASGIRLTVLGPNQVRHTIQVDFLGDQKPFTLRP